jgi:hypothetical protein
MRNRLFPYLLGIAVIVADAFGVSKMINGKPIPIDTIVTMTSSVQFIKPGDPYFDLDSAPIVALVNDTNHTITVCAPTMGNKDSLFFQFIPGNQIAVRISSIIHWEENKGLYSYEYLLCSDTSSVVPIWYFSIDNSGLYEEASSPEGWMLKAFPKQNKVKWADVRGPNQLLPGDSLTGFGLGSSTPPMIAHFEIWGQNKELRSEFSGYDSATVFILADIYSDISTKYMGLDGSLLAPDSEIENIEPVDWIYNRLGQKINVLTQMGYLDQSIETTVLSILENLSEVFKSKENQSATMLSERINTALAALEPYRNQMEPEAWAFITENLKYVLRHLDIVQFKEYP